MRKNQTIRKNIIKIDNNSKIFIIFANEFAMNIHFENTALQELYETGRTTDKNYRKLQPHVVKQFIHKVNYLRNAERIEDLYIIKSLHYEKKQGDLKHIESVWINEQYRLLFQSSTLPQTVIITEITLLKISKHYEH